MKKIAIIGSFSFNEDQKRRLSSLGEVEQLDYPRSGKEWSGISDDYDAIISDGNGLLENLYNLRNVFVTYPYIELGIFDSKILDKNKVLIANAHGGNRDSIVEWTMFMILSLFRKFNSKINVDNDIPFELTQSLNGKNTLIIGKGSIGTQIGNLCKSFSMEVDFFCRGDDLTEKSKDADLIVNALNCNSTSKNLLNEKFFMDLKKGSYYISFVRPYTYDINGVIKSLDSNILAGSAIDCDPERHGDTKNEFYKKCLSNNKILVTPHIAFATEQAKRNGVEIAVRNTESFLSGNPINLIIKK